jgi:hypothetical protein
MRITRFHKMGFGDQYINYNYDLDVESFNVFIVNLLQFEAAPCA